MNHYERLKVTQDAPPEVIRAAYRALAQALPQDEHREARLTELNTAYETLIDPELRQAYDTVLTVSVPAPMPDIVGQPNREARSALEDLGAIVTITTAVDPAATAGAVLRTEPAAGTTMPLSVTMVVAGAICN